MVTAAPGVILSRTRSAGDAIALTRAALAAGATRIVAAGGDGTVHEVANAVAGCEAELAVIPAGSGNDYARSLGVPEALDRAVAFAVTGRARATDAGEVICTAADGAVVRRVFVNIAEAGMGGDVVRCARVARRISGAWLSYQLGILAALAMLRRAPVSVTVDGERLGTFPNSNLIVGNGRYFGGGLQPLPQASLDDGLLDIAHIRDASRFEMARTAPVLRNGIPLDHPRVDQRRCRTLAVQSVEMVPVEADGEWLGYLPATFTVLPGALRVVRV